MKNMDFFEKKKNTILSNLSAAIKAQDETKIGEAMTELETYYADMVHEIVNGSMSAADQVIMSGRGIRQLTSEETKYYQMFIEAAQTNAPKQAIANIEKAMPTTVIDAVLEDIEGQYPLLNAIDFQNTGAIAKVIINKQGVQLATWGPLGSMASSDLSAAIDALEVDHCKLTARICIENDVLEAGPQWVDRYVRAILVDALAMAFETAVVTGTGKDEPIGMDRDISATASVVSGAYPKKTAVAITDLTQKTIGKLKAKVAKLENGRTRAVSGLILVCNPEDMYEKVEPAVYVLTPGGFASIVRDPLTIIPSAAVTKGEAIFGIGKRYLMAAGMPKNGKLEYDDSVKFLDDQRGYKIRLRGNGRAKDDSDFVLVSFTNLKEAAMPTRTV